MITTLSETYLSHTAPPSLKMNFSFVSSHLRPCLLSSIFLSALVTKACIYLYTLQYANFSACITLAVFLLIYYMQFSPTSLYCLPLSSNKSYRTTFSKPQSRRSSCDVRDQVSHPHTITSTYILA